MKQKLLKRKSLKRKLLTAMAGLTALTISSTASALLPFDDTGNLYVSMWLDNLVRVFDDDGNVVKEMTAPGLIGPRGMAFNPANGDMWLAGEFSNEIYIFNKKGKFKRKFGHPDFDEPLSITFRMTPAIRAKNQEVYISNSGGDPKATGSVSGSNNIMVFDQKGNHLRTFTNEYANDPNLPLTSLFARKVRETSFVLICCPVLCLIDVSLAPLRITAIPFFIPTFIGFTDIME